MLAPDIGNRLADLRRALGWTQEQLADEVGRRPNAVSEWERGVRKPPASLLARLCRANGWPDAMFEAGGPMPSTVVNPPTKPRLTPTPSRGRAHRYFAGVVREIMEDMDAGREVPATVALGYVTGLWNEATREAPQLMRPALDGEGGSGGNAAGE